MECEAKLLQLSKFMDIFLNISKLETIDKNKVEKCNQQKIYRYLIQMRIEKKMLILWNILYF